LSDQDSNLKSSESNSEMLAVTPSDIKIFQRVIKQKNLRDSQVFSIY
jgi:hypothetical protein